MDMKVSMDGLRRNLVSAYNRVVRKLKASLEENCADYELEDIHRRIDEDFDELRMEIAFLCCTYDGDSEDFSDLSDEADSLLDFMEPEEEDEG